MIETIFGGIILAIISAMIGHFIANRKLTILLTKISYIELTIVKLQMIIDDTSELKKDIDNVYNRVRALETETSVLDVEIREIHKKLDFLEQS